jgi:hypothetical protein
MNRSDLSAPVGIKSESDSDVRMLLLVISASGAKAPDALQPLGLLYTLFSRSSYCRRQMSPRPTRRERSQQRELEL